MPDNLFDMYAAKSAEYLIAVIFLMLFIPFWRYVSGRPIAQGALRVAADRWIGQLAGWFAVPEHLFFHPGHAWARFDDSQLVTVGMDDFAQKLVGDISAISLPAPDSRVGQGETAWSLISGAKAIDMLSPLDGTVVAVNDRVKQSPEIVRQDPYGDGWLFKVKAARPRANRNQLLSGARAKRWMEGATDAIQGMLSPELGMVLQDGGVPIQGIARTLDAEKWDGLCKQFFLTEVRHD
jgi:glycine cleavage system H protein